MSDENKAYYSFLRLLDKAYNSFEMDSVMFDRLFNNVLKALQREGIIQ